MNRLGGATSPYLLQHAGNPVDWWQWGEEAFAEARRRDVPLLISIGYAACHWCHVMAHESFEDVETAAQMNAGFVCVKVDREERPDVDSVYMTATQAMTGQGGWPMTVFATPSGKPFYCGTYYPRESRGGMPSFQAVLDGVSTAWRERRSEVERVGDDVTGRLARTSVPVVVDGGAPDAAALDVAVARLAGDFDPVHAGFGGAPKFPPSMTLLQLLRHHARTGLPQALDMVRRTCEAMARGGIYDQIGGGFARYAVDGTWTVPHFEKMLYDNALLLRAYTLLHKAVGGADGDGDGGGGGLFARVVADTSAFLLDKLRTAEGGFASALDADTDGVEGLTYVWTPEELCDTLGDSDGAWAAEIFHVTEMGTFEHGASVLELLADPSADDADRYDRVRRVLLAAREDRPQPHRDDKVVAAWNGLAITALVEASLAFDMPRLLEAALEAARLLADAHMPGRVGVRGGGVGAGDEAADQAEAGQGGRGARLMRTSRDGVASANPGVLEDYGCVAEAFCVLYSATGDKQWLELAAGLLETVREQFVSDEGFHDTAADADALYFRPSDPTDNATPSGASAAAAGFVAYAVTAGSLDHLDDADRALAAASRLAERAPRFAGYGLAVAEALLSDVPAAFVCPGPFCA